ncbi:MAG TPA: acyl carrier protein [Thermoleophilaceae bacterium]|nr:acyl carrier protein [Thermoleophilaceae bacterium]
MTTGVPIAVERARIEATLRNLLLETAGIPAELIDADAGFEGDLAMDSLSFVAFQVEVESTFGIDCPLDELRDVTSFAALVELVRRKVAVR